MEGVAVDRQQLQQLHDLTGRVAIVTGGTRGIGLAIAEGFAAAGANVAVASRKAEACAETEAHLRGFGVSAIGIPTHMGDVDAVNALVDCTVEEFGRLDIVVNNAANALTVPFGQLTVDAWDKSLGTNLPGPVFLIERALPHLEGSGHAAILNVISAGVFLFSPYTAMYAAAKSGLMSMTRSMAAVFAERGIRVNALGARHGGHRHGAGERTRARRGHAPCRVHAPRRPPRRDGRTCAAVVLRRGELHHRTGRHRRRRPRSPLNP